MEREDAGFRAANDRIGAIAEDLRKAELVRDRLGGLDEHMGSYPEGHDMRAPGGTAYRAGARRG